MPTGTVKWFDSRKGHGFLNGESGGEIFVHYATDDDRPELTEGAKVEYEIRQGEKGQRQ
jgi:cold shock protein